MILIGDVHGNLKTLEALLAKIPDSEKAKGVCFVGDLIDRGPNSRGVIDLVRNNNYLCVRGNHEDMLLSEFRGVLINIANGGHDWRYGGLWSLNGGTKTIDSYYDLVEVDGCVEEVFALDKFEEHIRWIETLPIYLEIPDIKNNDGRYLVVSHSHIINLWRGLHKESGVNRNMLLMELMWGRPYKLKSIQNIFSVIGHTPIKNGPKIKKVYANIDTGCYYNGESGYFKLTALQFPEMIVYQQENIDKKKDYCGIIL
jgi:serine/threonine protein phosphatase 1